MSTNNKPMTNNDFASILAAIVRMDGNTRKHIGQAFRASMLDLYNSKSVERLNQFSAVVSGMAYWPKVKRAVLIFGGGTVCEFGAQPARYFEPGRACVKYNTKNKLWEFIPQEKAQWAELCAEFERIKGCDYDCVPAKARPAEGMTLDNLRKQAAALAKSPEKWARSQRREIAAVLAALSGILKGFEIDIDTDMTATKHVAEFDGRKAGVLNGISGSFVVTPAEHDMLTAAQ